MRRKRDRRGRFLKRARAHNPHRRRRRRRAAAVHHRRRRNPVMAARRRSHRRRRTHRRRHNPGFKGLGLKGMLPNMEFAGTAVVGAVGSKYLSKRFLPQATGWMSPAATFGVAIAAGMLLKMLKLSRFASGVVTGGAVMAGIDALKMSPLGPQLAGVYVSPGGSEPVLSGGIGMFPPGFQDPSLAGADENAPLGFATQGAEYEDMY